MASRGSDSGDGFIPGKIFVGGLPRYTTDDDFVHYFGKYGEIIDSVIIKDQLTGRPRGFGFITYADPSVVDTVIAETHIINGKQVQVNRPIPRGSGDSKVFRTRKTRRIFVYRIPTLVTDDELKDFFSQYGKVVEHKIFKYHLTDHSRGFGFVTFDTAQVVDHLLADGNMIFMRGTQVEIKKAKRKKPSRPTPASSHGIDSREFRSGQASYGRGGGYGRGAGRLYGGRTGGYNGRGYGRGGYGRASYHGGARGPYGGRTGGYNGRGYGRGGYGRASYHGGAGGPYGGRTGGYRYHP